MSLLTQEAILQKIVNKGTNKLIVVHIIVETCITPVSAAISANGAVLQKTTSNTNSIKKRKKINSTECFFMDN